jgi:glycosyltransferase involved in cell wall biosynthesis
MRTSIIISNHNDGDLVRKTIESCIESSGNLDFEIILADDASTDGSVEEVAARFPIVRIHRQERRQGASPTKALGARNARGETLVFLDAHTKPENDAILRLVQDVEELDRMVVVTPTIAALDVQRWTNDFSQVGNGYRLDLYTFECGWLPLDQMRAVRETRKQFYESPALIGCVLAIGRELYEKLWGFDPQMRYWGIEDLDLSLKCWLMGYRILHDPQAVVGHRFRDTFNNYTIPLEHVVVNQLRMAGKNFTHGVWAEWLEGSRQRNQGRLPGHPEGLWARSWELFVAGRASLEQERSYLHGRRVRDEFWYAERFALPWPRLQVRAGVAPLGERLFPLISVSPGPSPSPPPKCKVTGVTPSNPTLFIDQPQTFTALGTSLAGVQWSAPGATPPTGAGPTFTTRWNTTGIKTVTASCGGANKAATVRVLTVQLDINNTPATTDDVVALKCLHPSHRSTVPCRIKVVGPAASALNVILTNPDGRLRFPNPADTTKTLSLAASGAFTAFVISGEVASVAKGDATIEVRLNTSSGAVVGQKNVTVFSFNPAQMLLTQGGNYGFVGNNFTVPGGVAVSFSSQATIQPAGLDCSAPQIAKLRIAIMQESSNFAITTTWNTPTIAWAPGTPSGTTITVPTTMRETITYAAVVVQPVNDGLDGASPLYSKSAGALMRPVGCAGGGAATSSDTPGQTAPRSFAQPVSSGGTVVGTVTWTVRVNTARTENFRTFCVAFDTVTQQFCAFREAIWTLNADSSAPNQHANVNADSPASADPATGVQANHAPTTTTDAGVGAATTTFVHP